MQCSKCKMENKETAKVCKKCGNDLVTVPLWRPTMKWHLSVLGIIYASLLLLFFTLNVLLKPYMRQIPRDITPWIHAGSDSTAKKAQ